MPRILGLFERVALMSQNFPRMSAGPQRETTMIAARHRSAANSHHSRIKSLPANQRDGKAVLLTDVWNGIGSSRLSSVCRQMRRELRRPARAWPRAGDCSASWLKRSCATWQGFHSISELLKSGNSL